MNYFCMLTKNDVSCALRRPEQDRCPHALRKCRDEASQWKRAVFYTYTSSVWETCSRHMCFSNTYTSYVRHKSDAMDRIDKFQKFHTFLHCIWVTIVHHLNTKVNRDNIVRYAHFHRFSAYKHVWKFAYPIHHNIEDQTLIFIYSSTCKTG